MGKAVKLVGGGFVINGATPSIFGYYLNMHSLFKHLETLSRLAIILALTFAMLTYYL